MDASVKAGLPGLVDHAAGGGWSARRACSLLGLDHWRAERWQQRRADGRLAGLPPGGHQLHGLMAWERAAITEHSSPGARSTARTASWPTAGRGSGWCTSASRTVARVLAAEGLVLEGPGPREPGSARALAGLAGVEARPDLGI